jgi:hypothetical protein
MLYRGFPSKLHHEVPHWVETGALFHIRIAVDREKEQGPLTDTPFEQALLDSARFYEINSAGTSRCFCSCQIISMPFFPSRATSR